MSILSPTSTLLGLETTKIPRPIPQMIIISPGWIRETGFPPAVIKPPIHEANTITIPIDRSMTSLE